MAVVEIPRQPLRQFARLVVVEIDQRRDARPGPADFDRSLLQAGAGKVADRLGAVGIAARLHEAVELGVELIIDGDGHTLHRYLPIATGLNVT